MNLIELEKMKDVYTLINRNKYKVFFPFQLISRGAYWWSAYFSGVVCLYDTIKYDWFMNN